MKSIQNLTLQEQIQTLQAEIAKSLNEIHTAKRDVDKAAGRLSFCQSLLKNLDKEQK